MVHGFLRAERQGRIKPREAANALAALLDLSLTVDLPDPLNVMSLARELRLTGYDATYLALAIKYDLPVATAGAVLAKAARAMNLLWDPEAM